MTTSMKLPALIALVFTTAVGGIASAALAKPSHSHRLSRHHATHRATAAAAPVAQPDAALAASLGAFRRPASGTDRLPDGVKGALTASRGLGDVNPNLARAVGAGHNVYVMPGNGQFCVGRSVDPGSVLFCASSSSLTAGDFVGAVTHTGSGFVTTIVLGDSASNASITTAAGTAALALVDGGASFNSSDAPSAVAWTDASGERRTQVLSAG